MRSPALLLAVILLTACPAHLDAGASGVPDGGPVLLLAVHPASGPDWEHVHLVNPTDDAIDLSGWRLDDGEGRWELPEGATIGSGQRLAVAVNATAHAVLWGRPPDVLATAHGRFGLADRGDSLALLDASGAVVDQLWYGSGLDDPPPGWSGVPVPTPSTVPWGRLLKRNGPSDTDAADDWAGWTEPRCGWLDPPVDATAEARAACFVTPDGGWEALAWALASGERSLDVALYDITSWDLAALIADRASSGVRTRLLVEGRPVGATSGDLEDRSRLLAALVGAGVDVWTTFGTERGVRHAPYRYHHEKYCVVDGRTSVVTTENWSPGSFPPPGASWNGSRGWGAVIESTSLSSALGAAFEHDVVTSAGRWDPEGAEPLHLPPPRRAGEAPALSPCRARLAVGPEAWGADLAALLDVMGAAEESIHLELAYLEVWWGGATSPLVDGLLEAALRGVDVRLVLDPGADGGGREALQELHLLASRRGALGLRGVLAADLPGADRLHAKGVVVDGRTALLGSLNWGWSSVARNREVVVAVESAAAVASLEEAFRADWNASVSSAPAAVPAGLLMDALDRWQGPPFPARSMGPIGQEGGAPGGPGDGWAPRWTATARAVLVLSLATAAWAVERRFGVRARLAARVDGAVGGAVGRLLTRPSRRPSGGEGGPCAPPASGPPPDPGPGPPPPPPPEGGRPRRRPPRVVRLPPP